jgi:hypothetical protein
MEKKRCMRLLGSKTKVETLKTKTNSKKIDLHPLVLASQGKDETSVSDP